MSSLMFHLNNNELSSYTVLLICKGQQGTKRNSRVVDCLIISSHQLNLCNNWKRLKTRNFMCRRASTFVRKQSYSIRMQLNSVVKFEIRVDVG